jgi:hypothetical protein
LNEQLIIKIFTRGKGTNNLAISKFVN